MQSPLYRHNCQECKYLATFEDKDLYFCKNHGVPLVKARYSNEEKDVEKGLGLAKSEPLEVAQALSLRRGLVTSTEVEGAKTKKIDLQKAISDAKCINIDSVLSTEREFTSLSRLPLRRVTVAKLIKDPSVRVKERIANREDLLEGDIKKLSLDESPLVRGQIAHRVDLPRQIISNLLKDPDDRVLKIILNNQSVPNEIAPTYSLKLTDGSGGIFRRQLSPWNSSLAKRVKSFKKVSTEDQDIEGAEPFLFTGNVNWSIYLKFFLWKEWESPSWTFAGLGYGGINIKKEWVMGEVELPQEIDGFLEAGDFYTFPNRGKSKSPTNKERLDTPIVVGIVEIDEKLGFWICPIKKLQERITYLECFPEFSWEKTKEINAECLGMAMGGSAEGKGKGLLALWGIDGKAIGWTSEERSDKIPKYRLLRQEDLIPKFWEPKLKSLEEIEKIIIGQELSL